MPIACIPSEMNFYCHIRMLWADAKLFTPGYPPLCNLEVIIIIYLFILAIQFFKKWVLYENASILIVQFFFNGQCPKLQFCMSL